MLTGCSCLFSDKYNPSNLIGNGIYRMNDSYLEVHLVFLLEVFFCFFFLLKTNETYHALQNNVIRIITRYSRTHSHVHTRTHTHTQEKRGQTAL